MPSTLEIRRRLRSIKSTSKITKAMELISASKLRRAQVSAEKSRYFTEALKNIIRTVEKLGKSMSNSLLEKRTVNKSLIITITSDKGLAGSFNLNILRETLKYLDTPEGKNCQFITIGKKAQNQLSHLGHNIIQSYSDFPTHPTSNDIRPIVKTVIDMYMAKEIDKVVIIYTMFKSIIKQTAVIDTILPLTLSDTENLSDNICVPLLEPDKETVINTLVPQIISGRIYHAVLESNASEHAARMIAMHNATDAAVEIIDDLTLTYNSVRQATITKELSEMVTGASAI